MNEEVKLRHQLCQILDLINSNLLTVNIDSVDNWKDLIKVSSTIETIAKDMGYDFGSIEPTPNPIGESNGQD